MAEDNATNVYVNLIIKSEVEAYSTGEIYINVVSEALGTKVIRTYLPGWFGNFHFTPDYENNFDNRLCKAIGGANNTLQPLTTDSEYLGKAIQYCQFVSQGTDGLKVTLVQCTITGENGIFVNGGTYTINITGYTGPTGGDSGGSGESGGSDTPGENPDSGGGSGVEDIVKINLTINSNVEAFSSGEVLFDIGSAVPYVRMYLSGWENSSNLHFTTGGSSSVSNQVCYTYDEASDKKETISTNSPLLGKNIRYCEFVSRSTNGLQTDLIQCSIEGGKGKFVNNGNYTITITGYTGPIWDDSDGGSGGDSGGGSGTGGDTPDTPSGDDIDNADKVAIKVPVIKGTINSEFVQAMKDLGYVKARAVVVYPSPQDRKILCQGVATPAIYTEAHRGIVTGDEHNLRDLYAQSSWFFRPALDSGYKLKNDANSPISEDEKIIEYVDKDGDPEKIKMTEIQGHYDAANKFRVTWDTLTFHSPDIELDNSLINQDYTASNLSFAKVGDALFKWTFSDIDIQTETPAISSRGSGFVKKSFTKHYSAGIISGLFWDDYLVDDNTKEKDNDGNDRDTNPSHWFEAFTWQKAPAKWMVYLWNKNGSLNNDMARPANSGVQSAVLKRKIISNLRIANTSYQEIGSAFSYMPHLYNLDTPGIIKLRIEDKNISNVYRGNIDTLLIPDEQDGMYFSIEYTSRSIQRGFDTEQTITFESPNFTSPVEYKTFGITTGNDSVDNGTWGVYVYTGSKWRRGVGDFFEYVGNDFHNLVLKKEGVRMKYKSTPHLVLVKSDGNNIYQSVEKNSLPVMELKRTFDNGEEILFGGRSQDALRENTWIPCGEPVRLDNTDENGDVHYEYSWGDTYFQRWDCLKTYAFTPEDINQVVEIGSFMLETHINMDGRYDRNRGQSSNLYMSPQNFNLINMAYTQLNNFFSYKTKDKDSYSRNKYENQIVWSKTKTSGADVDLWTNITLSSPLELDGDKGPVNKLARYNDQLIAFQNRGTAQILYNENVQISTEQGVPIELANSGKVQGKRYISDSIGCVNKWSVCTTPMGIYFMDSVDKNIYLFNGQLNNVSSSLGMNSWVKQNIPPSSVQWAPYRLDDNSGDGFLNFVTYNDRLNQDVLFINGDTALAYSEKLAAFTSFYDYGHTPYFCNFADGGVWIRNDEIEGQPVTSLHGHQQGDYCSFFGVNKPFWTILVSNPEPQADKIFTNLEFRACVEGDGELDSETGKFTPTLPFDTLETWNEYQKGIAFLTHRNGHSAMLHHTPDNVGSLKRKFRIWRCDVPRDNGNTINVWDNTFDDRFLNPERRRHSNDRMRNPWLYVKLLKRASEDEVLKRTEIHDILMTYFA